MAALDGLVLNVSPFFTKTRLLHCMNKDCRNWWDRSESLCNSKEIYLDENGVCKSFQKRKEES